MEKIGNSTKTEKKIKMSVLVFEFMQMLIDTRIKEYKQLSHINLKD